MLLSHTIIRPDLELHVDVRAGATPVVLIHGLAGTATEWQDVAEALPSPLGVIAPDLRAHGRSRGVTDPVLTAARFTDDIVALLEQTTTVPATLVGQSMGGVVASRVAAARPDLVAHLVLVDAGIAPLDDDVDTLERWLRTAETGHDPDSMLAVIRAVCGDDRAAEWTAVSCATTVVLAQHTLIDGDDLAEMRRLRPEGTYLSVAASGHDIHLDQPAALAALLHEIAT